MLVVSITVSLQYAESCEGTSPEPEDMCAQMAQSMEEAQEMVDQLKDPVKYVIIYVLGNMHAHAGVPYLSCISPGIFIDRSTTIPGML